MTELNLEKILSSVPKPWRRMKVTVRAVDSAPGRIFPATY
jgi:hypothetical protein